MEQKTKKEPVITIKLNKNFYSEEAVRRGILAYKKLARFSLKINGGHIIITAKNICNNFENILADEFCNYVLSEMKNDY